MTGRKIRRKVRKRKTAVENSRMKLWLVFGIIALTGGLGFLTANQADAAGQTDEKAAAEADGKQQKEGYVLQFGAFSTKAAAQELSDALQAKGIKTRVVEIDSVFKVLSPVTEQKESALQALQEAKEKNVSEVFIAAMEG